MQNKNPISLKYKAILTMLAAALFASCTNLVTRTPQDTIDGGGINKVDNSARGALTVTARVSGDASRYAMPTIPELVYAALLYPNVNSSESTQTEVFVKGEMTDENKIQFSFQRPNETDGISFTLEVFAFVKAEGEGTTTFSRTGALFSGHKDNLPIADDTDAIEVDGPIALSSSKQGTVALQIKVPADCTLEIDETTASGALFTVEGASPNFTIKQKQNDENGISAGAYPVTFTVKKKVGENDEIIHVFSENINVLNGLCTDTWSGLEKGEAKDITNSISKTVYVRGENAPWYTSNAPNATASDENSGSYLAPLATIQKAVDTIIARNDGTSDYTICIDGTLKYDTSTYIGTNGMADFSALRQKLNLTIKALSDTATLDGGARFDADGTVETAGIGKRIICANHATNGKLNLTLEKLVIMGGDNGGVYVHSSSELTMNDCEVSRCITTYTSYGGGVYVNGGRFTMNGGAISDCTATNQGGGVYIASNGTFNMSGTAKITGCKTTSASSNTGGGGIYSEGTVTITGGAISSCTSAKNGGGIFVNSGTFTMDGGTISNCTATTAGGGVCVKDGTFTMSSGTISGNEATSCGGVYANGGFFRMKGGIITGNNSYGVYMNGGNFYMSDMAKVESNNIVYGNSMNTIIISGALNATAPVATFNIGSYGVDRTVLRADTDTNVSIDEDICSKIALTAEGCKIVPSADGKKGVLKVHTIFLNSENGSDSKYGVNASTAVKTLSKAIEKYDTYNAEKIMVCAPYTLPSGESTLLDRTDKTHLTLMRYAGSSDGSGALTGNLVEISQGSVDIVNTTLDGNKDNVSAEGRLLYISGSTTTVSLGTDATLCNNKATDRSGGAVYIKEGTFEMRDGTITGNEAIYGGGIMVYMCTLKMTGGAITGNEAQEGGGVNNNASTFEMSGGTISGNTATLGSGVYQNGTFTMSLAAKVESDNDVYLPSNKTIRASSNLSASNPVATITPSSYSATRKVLLSNSGGTPTLAVCNKFAVTPEADGTQWIVSYSALGGVLMKRES